MRELWTEAGEALRNDPGRQPWAVYPRPQMRREKWINLNGTWQFRAETSADWSIIRVPFPPESRLSGVGQHFPEGCTLFYRRRVTVPENFRHGRVLLHIGAADQYAEVSVNGSEVARHTGGYEAFTADVTEFLLPGENTLEIRCRDDLRSHIQPYGKQTQTRGGMWYTPVSGIWQTVWLESVPETYIRTLCIDIRGESAVIRTEPLLSGAVTVDGLGEFPLSNGEAVVTPEAPRLWSPEDPYLYEFTVRAGEDCVRSYFALRTLEIREAGGYRRLCLNGKPYFFHGLLDQGYWPDGLFTPAEPECYARDILAMKRLGFNTLRKHIKIEPEEFYYQCDRLGMIVFQDMVNNGKYHYLRDTALPTVWLAFRHMLSDRRMQRNAAARTAFLAGMDAAVHQLRSHPCICYWTIFNEGWGQFDSAAAYAYLRKLDASRFIDTTSGWFQQGATDVDSWHIYFRALKLAAGEKPLVLSEFGGYSWKDAVHCFNPDQTYGYGKYASRNEFADAFRALYMQQVVPHVRRGLCAAIYTQVSDIEDETNGLVTYDRRRMKLTPEETVPIAQALAAALQESVNKKVVATSEKLG